MFFKSTFHPYLTGCLFVDGLDGILSSFLRSSSLSILTKKCGSGDFVPFPRADHLLDTCQVRRLSQVGQRRTKHHAENSVNVNLVCKKTFLKCLKHFVQFHDFFNSCTRSRKWSLAPLFGHLHLHNFLLAGGSDRILSFNMLTACSSQINIWVCGVVVHAFDPNHADSRSLGACLIGRGRGGAVTRTHSCPALTVGGKFVCGAHHSSFFFWRRLYDFLI